MMVKNIEESKSGVTFVNSWHSGELSLRLAEVVMELAAGGDLMEALQSHRTGFQVSSESMTAPRTYHCTSL